MSVKLLSLSDYSLSYGNTKVLSNINVELSQGEFVCLCGPNGAGKSTLMKALMESIPAKNSKERSRIAAFLPQTELSLYDFNVFDTVLSGRFCHTGILGNYSKNDEELVCEILNDFGLWELREKSVKEISGGEFQKVRLARSFAQDSQFLLLDEPLSSLDFVVSQDFMELLKEKAYEHKKGVLISIHDINFAARYAKTMVLLGKYNEKSHSQILVKGSVSEIMTEENLFRIYQKKVKLFSHPETGVPQI